MDSLPAHKFVCLNCSALVTNAKRALPHMAAYLCLECACHSQIQPVKEGEIINRSFAPWSASELKLLNEYQLSSVFLPFVCNNEHELIARPDGMVCPECIGFKIDWVYTWMLYDSWKLL